METKGYIYILTNPSFPNLVKIGYAKDVERRVKELNRSSCIPFSFRIYGYYKVNTELSVVKAIAGKPCLSFINLPTNSAAKC